MDTSVTALKNAIDGREMAALQQLIAAGGDVNAWDADGQWPLLHYAGIVRNHEAVAYLLKHGADVFAKDAWGYTLLTYAFSAESPRLVELALTYGASTEEAMLDVAWLLLARVDNVPLMQQLYARGAKLTAAVPNDFLCKLGGQAVHLLHKFDRLTEVLKTDDFDADSLVGFNALMLALAFECAQLAAWLVTLPFDVNHRSANGSSALLEAAGKDDYADIVNTLLAKGANPNAMDDSGWSALQAALRNNATKNAQALLNAGADACYIDDEGYSTLMAAAKGGCEVCVPDLLASGVAVNAEWQGKTALDIALHNRHHEIADLITAAGGKHGSQPTFDDEASQNAPMPEGYIEDLVAQLKRCVPTLDADVLLSMAPPAAFEDAYGNQTTVLYWLSDGLEAQGLLAYQEWKAYWGDLPALRPVKGLALDYDPQPLVDVLENGSQHGGWDTEPPPYLALMNHHLKPHGLQIISFAFENLYMLCVHDDTEQIQQLADLLAQAGIHVITHTPMDLPTCMQHMQADF
jgi:ankyrin repeat protein